MWILQIFLQIIPSPPLHSRIQTINILIYLIFSWRWLKFGCDDGHWKSTSIECLFLSFKDGRIGSPSPFPPTEIPTITYEPKYLYEKSGTQLSSYNTPDHQKTDNRLVEMDEKSNFTLPASAPPPKFVQFRTKRDCFLIVSLWFHPWAVVYASDVPKRDGAVVRASNIPAFQCTAREWVSISPHLEHSWNWHNFNAWRWLKMKKWGTQLIAAGMTL